MKNCDVRNYGAAGDGVTLDTGAIQAAIDDCNAAGGGRVTVEDGTYLFGRIDLKSGVELYIARDAVLLGSPDPEDFPDIESDFWHTEYAARFNKKCYIYAENAKDIAITGRGVIDLQGEHYLLPCSEEEIDYRPHMSFKRKNRPIADGTDPDSLPVAMVGTYAHPLDPRVTSLAPARVVFFIGCENVLVEDVTMRRQPAGWSYWICGCENVYFHRAQIFAQVDAPNNDGIHINCCKGVNITDCNISTGDDCVVVRAYSAPLGENRICEKVCVTNCNMTSHTAGVRVGWIGDGVIRNCTFSNLNITESCCGIMMRLPPNPSDQRMSDQGFEDTFIENISFTNITIDRNYLAPVRIEIEPHSPCKAIRNIYFSHLHAFSAQMPIVKGRPDHHLSNIYFSDCHFHQVRFEEIDTVFAKRMAKIKRPTTPPDFQCVDNLVLDSTAFTLL